MPKGGARVFTRTEIMRRWRARHRKQYNDYMKSWRDKNPAATRKQTKLRVVRNPDWNHNNHLKRNFNLDAKAYKKMLEEQGGVCKICKQPETALYKGRIRRLAVEHCHETEKIRGLVCNRCNMAIMWKESFDRCALKPQVLEYLSNA